MADSLNKEIELHSINGSEEYQGSLMITRCQGCYRNLRWPAPCADSWATAISCPECGQYFFTEGRSTDPPTLTEQPASTHPGIDMSHWLSKLRLMQMERPQSIELMTQLVGNSREVDERREHVRFEVENPIVGVPLDEQAKPTGVAVDVTLTDLSISGMQLAVAEVWHAPLVAVDFGKLGLPGAQLIAEVVWQDADDTSTRLGCRFLLSPDGRLPLS